MTDIEAFGWITLGIILSVIVPITRKFLDGYKVQPTGLGETFKEFSFKYIGLAVASLVIGVMVLAIMKYTGGTISNWYEGVVGGYLFDSTLQKLKN